MLVRLFKFALCFVKGVAFCWAALVLLLSPALPLDLRTPATIAFVGTALLAIVWRRSIIRLLPLLLFVGVVLLWFGLTPSNDRRWTPDAVNLPWAEVKGDEVTIHNIRNFNYRSENDFDLNYSSKKVKLSELSEVDIIASYWAGKSIAHIMVSFGFNHKDFLAFSIETRKEEGEAYSATAGFFRNYELMYVVADERDLFRVRTTFREPPERVYLLRTDAPLENGRKLLLAYIETMNQLGDTPQFYNSLTTNCTTSILMHAKTYATRVNYNWKVLASGYLPDYLFEMGGLAPGFEFEELMRKSLINERSIAAGTAEDYSLKIREGIPKPQPKILNERGEVISR